MGHDVRVSFVIPALNAEKTIGRCLESVRAQDYPQDMVEVIVVDNGSRDGTAGIARRHGSTIVSDGAGTISRLRNAGARHARGEMLVFMDSDCVIPRDWIRIARSRWDDAGVVLVGSKTYHIPDGAGWVDRTWRVHLERSDASGETDWVGSILMLVKRSAFDAVGGFDGTLATCEDIDLCYRIGKVGKIVSDERLAPVHLGTVGTLSAFFRKEVWRGRDNMRVTLRHIRTPMELLGLLWIVYYAAAALLLSPAVILSAVSGRAWYAVIIIAALIAPIVFRAFTTCRKTGKYSYFGKLSILYSVYIAARIRALFS